MSVLSPHFDDNTEDLLHLLTDVWDNPLKETIIESKWTRDYLTKLTSLSLDELLHEPAQLREEQAKAKRDAQQLAFRDYPSFLHAQTCRHEAEETLDGLDVHLGDFLSSVPELQQACEEFGEHAQILKEERGKITSVLEHQNVLTDLLEIPQLMETCVWNGYYSEAMDLASHVRLLQVRYPLSVIKSIQQQVQSSTDLMLVQLISHLRKPIRLAAAMNVVGFLRRMDVFETETELRMVFLRCRHDFLQQRLVRVKRDISEDIRQRSVDAFEYLKRFVDVMREQMFEIGTQYISIFSNEQGTLLSDYMVHITGLIKTALNTYLPMIEDTSALASLLTQLQYCGMSLGRIGLDFRHIFVHSFEEAVQPMILRWIDASTEDLVKLITKSTEEASAPSTWMSSKIVSQNTNNTSTDNEVRRHPFQPPMLLVGYPSLAIFTNGILSAFNALRLLPAISLYLPIQNHLDACFLEIGNALKQYSDQAASHIPDEITYLQSFTAAYIRCCIPFLKSCLVDGIYDNLSTYSSVDDNLESLLLDYLPAVKKDIEMEELKEMNEPELTKKEEKESIDISIKEEKEQVDCTIDKTPATTTELTDQKEHSESSLDSKTSQQPEKNNLIVSNNENEIKTHISSEKLEETPVIESLVDQDHIVIEEQPTINKAENDIEKNTKTETIKEESNVKQSAIEEPSVEKSVTVEETSVEKSSVEETSVEETTVEKTSVEETAVEETAVEETAVEETAVEETAVEETAVEETAVEETAVENTPVEETAVENTPVEETAVENTPVEETAVENNSMEETAVEETAVEKTTVEKTAVEETAVEETDIDEETTLGQTVKKANIKEPKIKEEPVAENHISEETAVEKTSVKETKNTVLLDDNNHTELKENTHIKELPSNTEHTDDNHKEDADIKPTLEKKQPKTAKKHKGKKGRR